MFEDAKIIFTPEVINVLSVRLEEAQKAGKLGMVKRILALLALAEEIPLQQAASTLRCSVPSIYIWLREFIVGGFDSLQQKKSSGRPSKLSGTQKEELGKMIDMGPEAFDYPGGCWRSPMIQNLIYRKFGKFYSVKYIAQLLKNMNFSFQKAKFVSAHLDEKKRREWLDNIWPEIRKVAKQKNAAIMFGDEVSFPMWGSLSYTWSRKGCRPVIKTSGKRKGHKIFGLISYTDGKFFSAGIEGRFNSETYINFIKSVFVKNNKHIILIQDGAKYHVSRQTKEFFKANEKRLTVYQLPSYSPDYNPIEKLWKKIKESHIHLHYFPTFEDLKKKVQEAMLKYEDMQNEVLALFGFYRDIEMAEV